MTQLRQERFNKTNDHESEIFVCRKVFFVSDNIYKCVYITLLRVFKEAHIQSQPTFPLLYIMPIGEIKLLIAGGVQCNGKGGWFGCSLFVRQ